MGAFPSTRPIRRDEWSVWPPDRRAVEVASRQRGRIAIEQLKVAGLSKREVERRVEKGLLHREHQGVYVVGHLAEVPLGREAGALLAAGPEACLSDTTAAVVSGLLPFPLTSAVELTVPPSRRVERTGIRAHRRHLGARDVTRHEGLPVTTPLRTLQDLVSRVDRPRLERMAGEAHGRRLVPLATLTDLLGGDMPQITRSKAEQLLLRLVRRAGLPEPEMNAKLGPWTVDALWHRERVALELDSWSWHATKRSFERDRAKDRALRRAGLTPVRATATQLEQEPEAVVADLAATLATAWAA